ncbi:hypothetical protein DQ04_00221130 [Trypanosoma grayi]|uniref:hypothetical protein n=1 Tax=Trypanosoma grayi TaxID=71804 RepID=UPI0004F43239|nr:hypothetical protein DQ04_00221130 [Trypanosoma grayi]KEG15010.1 hypothetical protein DQ04_00221130 [Trypanosoma grayi]
MSRVSMVAGHAVRSPSQVSVGGGGRWLAYSCAEDIVVVCALKHGGAVDSPDNNNDATTSRGADFVDATRTVLLQNGEKLSVIHLHQSRDLLCIGTADSGLYLTTASDPTFAGATAKLPIRLTGESVFAACFLNSVHESSDVLVVSCGMKELAKDRFRLSLWDVQTRTLLWRGCADALDVIVALPGSSGFASCTSREVTLWSVQRSDVGEAKTQEGSKNASAAAAAAAASSSSLAASTGTAKCEDTGSGTLTVLSKPCSVVSELRDTEFVALVPPVEGETTLTALTTVGFLVSFDCRSGAAVKWMDCKVCPATAAYQSANNVIVCGALVRFFSADSWEFRGKIKQNGPPTVVSSSFLTRLMDSLCTGAAVCPNGDRLMLFYSGGDLSRYRVTESTSGTIKLSFQCVYQYTPVLPDEEPLRWIPLAANVLCLWSPQRLRLYDMTLRSCSSMALESTCATYHTDLNVLLVYVPSAYEIAAIMPNLEEVLCRLSVAEPLTSLVAYRKNQFVGLSPDNSLFYFEGRWNEGTKFSLQALHTTRLTSFKVPLTQLVWAEGALCAASTHLLANLQTGKNVSFSADIISFTAAGDALLVVHRHGCVVVEVDTLQPVGEPLQAVALKEVVSAPNGGLVALRSEGELSVVSLADRKCITHLNFQRAAQNHQMTVLMSVGFTADGSGLVLCDSRGIFTLHALTDTGFDALSTTSSSAASRAVPDAKRLTQQKQQHRGRCSTQRSSSCGGPTNVELQSRFKDLHGFYEFTRRKHKEHEGAYKRVSAATATKKSPSAPANSTTTVTTASTTTTTTTTAPTTATTRSTSGVLILAQGNSILQIPSTPLDHPLPPLRKWESDRVPTELPQVLGAAESFDVGVSTSMVEVSALTSIESKPTFRLRTLSESEADMTPSLAADVLAQDRAKVTFAEAPAYGVRSPARKGQPSLSPMRTPEDDVVNIDSMEREDVQRQLHHDPVNMALVQPFGNLSASSSSSSVRARSLEIRDRLKELAEAYDQQKEDEDNDADCIDDETVEELFSTVNRLYTRLQLRQQQRPSSAGSAVSEFSIVSVNAMLAELQRQSSRIEAQNQEILASLIKK